MVGGLIRLGMVTDKFAMAEGWENSYAWWQLARGPEDISIGAAVDLGNLSGGWTGREDHPTRIDPKTGKKTKIPNAVPDMSKPGVILPAYVKELILLADGDSEQVATWRAVLTGGRRYASTVKIVSVDPAPIGYDWNSYANALAEIPEAVAA